MPNPEIVCVKCGVEAMGGGYPRDEALYVVCPLAYMKMTFGPYCAACKTMFSKRLVPHVLRGCRRTAQIELLLRCGGDSYATLSVILDKLLADQEAHHKEMDALAREFERGDCEGPRKELVVETEAK